MSSGKTALLKDKLCCSHPFLFSLISLTLIYAHTTSLLRTPKKPKSKKMILLATAINVTNSHSNGGTNSASAVKQETHARGPSVEGAEGGGTEDISVKQGKVEEDGGDGASAGGGAGRGRTCWSETEEVYHHCREVAG